MGRGREKLGSKVIEHVVEQATGAAAIVTRMVLEEDRGAGYATLEDDQGNMIGVVLVTFSRPHAERLIIDIAELGKHTVRRLD